MKVDQQNSLTAEILGKARGGQSVQFEAFKDEQFFSHKKNESLMTGTSQNVIGSLNVLALTNFKKSSHHNNRIELNFTRQARHKNKSKYEVQNAEFRQVCSSQQVGKDKGKSQSAQKISKVSRLQRYNQSRQNQLKPNGQKLSEQYTTKTNNQKIGILKRIIEHYNIKSIQNNYESNLINTSSTNINASQSCKNRFVTVKKIVPKSAIKRQRYSSNRNQITKIKFRQGQMNGYDIIDSYFNHNKIIVQAQSINDLIKNAQDLRAKLNPSPNKYESKLRDRMPVSKKQGVPNCLNKKSCHKYETMPAEKMRQFQSVTENCINVKINKFKEFLFMINFSNQIYRELDITKYESPFKIFIGQGNNNNLIKAIIKKRFWFQIVKTSEEANFIWTQLKDENIYQRQNLLNAEKREKEQQKQSKSHRENQETKISFIQQSIIVTNNRQKSVVTTRNTVADDLSIEEQDQKRLSSKAIEFQIRQRKELKSRKIKDKGNAIYQPETRIMTKDQLQSQKQLMYQMFTRRKSNFNDRVRFLKGFKIVEQDQLRQELIHNHLPVNGLLGNKKAMFYMLHQYYRLTKRDVFNVVPLTFHIKRGFLDDQFKSFMNKFVHNRSHKIPNYWIMKPGQFSNRGQGITCSNKLEEIRSRVGSLRNTKNKSLILQQYITNPFLYNGRKFDIRTYMLLTINNGKLRGYWYQQGYIRTSSYTWTLQQIGDTYIHLTNDAIQKYSSNYGRYEPGNKLTYSELQRYFDSVAKNTNKHCNFHNDIYPQLKEIAADAIKSCFCFIDPQRNGNNFQIFGFDFMIDSNFKPWLIQINTNPCLEMSCPVLDRIIPSMVQNAFRIGLDPIIPPPLNYSSNYKYSIPENALHYNKFQVIFDEERDGRFLYELYNGNEIVKLIDEYEQDKQIYEEEGQEISLEES